VRPWLARISKILEREGVPGIGLALVDRDGVVWAGGVGVADRETGRPVDANTQFHPRDHDVAFTPIAADQARQP
jgi:CubicO group peptidase (beta-lactamase class C family)